MSPRHDPPVPHEPLTPEERAWAERLARIGPHDGPPPALDTKILAAAQAAVAQRPHRRSQRRRWPTLVGAAASLVIVVGLAWQLQPLLRPRPSLGEGPAAAVPAPSAEGSLSADVLAAADPITRTGVSSPPPPSEPTVAKTLRKPRLPPPAVANTPAPTAAATKSPEFVDDAIPPYADYAGMAAAREAASQAVASEAAARASTDERRERAAAASPQPFPAARSDAAAAANLPLPPPAAAPPAPAPTGRMASPRDATARKATAASQPEAARAVQAAPAEQGNSTLDRIEVTGPRLTAADLPVRDDARLEPAAWLQRIRDRRDADDLDGARESLALFRKSHPRVRLPADLADLGR